MTPDDERSDHDVEALLQQHLPRLEGFVRLRTGPLLRSMESSSDLVQSVCREILEHRERFRVGGEEGFRRWLYTSALRKISNRLKYYRAERRDPRNEVRLDERAAPDASRSLLECYGTFCTPSRALRGAEEVRRIEQAFDRLPEHYREVITLARIVRLSHAEIAEQTGRSEGSVRMLLFRALERLSALLEEDDA